MINTLETDVNKALKKFNNTALYFFLANSS